MSRKVVQGVLHNFIQTYTSRYSDFDGYWLFGMLVDKIVQFDIDLMNDESNIYKDAVITTAVRLASTKFKDQADKAGLNLSCIREASLAISKSPGLRNGYVNGRMSVGFEMNFVARTVSLHGKIYERKKSLFVAPHDPRVEQRSARGT